MNFCSSGKFVTKMAGVYSMFVSTYSSQGVDSRVAIILEYVNGTTVNLCEAHAILGE